jgi:predicted phosphohydrolase
MKLYAISDLHLSSEVNRQALEALPPRFVIWCGTQRTADWHTRFPVSVVVYGHLHVPGTHFRDGVRFEEVALGLPQWNWDHGDRLQQHLREILPGNSRARP